MGTLADRPVFIAWAMEDPVFRPEFIEQFWLRTFPKARVERVAEAGHYSQEDAHERLVPWLLGFLAEATPTAVGSAEDQLESSANPHRG